MDPEIFKREEARTRRLWDNLALSVNDSREGTIHQSDYYFSKWRQAGKTLCQTYFGQDFPLEQWEDYATAVNVMCAELFKDIIEYCRASRPDKTGVIWWSLMDMWPMLFNYSVMDCNGLPKLPYYWIRQAQQEVALMAVRKDLSGKLSLYVANDTLQEQSICYTVESYDADGNHRVILVGDYAAAANASAHICELPEEKPAMLILRWNINGKTCVNHAFTADVSYPVMLRWLKLLKEACPEYDIYLP